MLFYENQLNLGNIYSDCSHLFEEQKPEFLNLMNTYLHIDDYISWEFKRAFYSDTGRPRDCSLLGYISSLVLQKIFTIPTDSLLILILTFSSELRELCGVAKIPDSSQYTRFKQDFDVFIEKMFIDLVDITEPICQAIDSKLSDMISLDTTGVEAYVSENNAKYINSVIKKLKAYFKIKGISKSDDDIYKQAYKSMPKVSVADPAIRKMYANGHFCYARKFGIITNGLGIPRHIDFFDDDFKSRHQDFFFADVDSFDYDRTIADSKSLIPILSDFYSLHPDFKHSIFLGDAAFDAVKNYDFLLKKDAVGNSLFDKAFIPLNSRATTDKPDCPIDENGIPLCPRDNSLKMSYGGFSHEKRQMG